MKKRGCQSKTHRACYGILWDCTGCQRRLCSLDLCIVDKSFLCERCWHRQKAEAIIEKLRAREKHERKRGNKVFANLLSTALLYIELAYVVEE